MALPDFYILGEMKCGSTSLWNYLRKHPQIVGGIKGVFGGKEVNHLNRANFNIKEYKKQFPQAKKGTVIVEGSVRYFVRSSVINRMKQYNSNAKFVLILRDPVDRTYSHYNHKALRNPEKTMNFERMIKKEIEYLKKNNFTKSNYADGIIWHSLYYIHLKRWLEEFNVEQFLVLKTKDLDRDPQGICSRIFKFVGVKDFPIHLFIRYLAGDYADRKLKPNTRKYLENFFSSWNDKFYKLTGINI